jgi:hypothetical protein
MLVLRRLTVTLAFCALALLTAIPSAGVSAAPSHAVGVVYVNLNTAGTNSVAGFARHADGALTALPGSPFSVGGAGTGTAIGTQGALQLSADGRYLLAADAGSNEVSVLRIKPDGSLQAAEGSPVASGGGKPASIAVHGGLVYVANTGGTPNYTGFTLNAGGRLRPIAGATVPEPGANIADVLFNGDGTRLVGTRLGTALIDSFTVDSGGLLHAAPGSPFQGVAGTFAGRFRPTNPGQLFVANTAGGTGTNGPSSLAAYTDSATGVFQEIGGPVSNDQKGSCWIEITPDGRYAYTSNAGSDTISRYALAADGTPTYLSSTHLQGSTDLHPFDLRADAGGRYLYVAEVDNGSVGVLQINGDGSLTELAGSPVALPSGAKSFGIAVA